MFTAYFQIYYLFDLWCERCEKLKRRHTLYWYSYKIMLMFEYWIQRYRWNELSVSYLHTYLLTYLLTTLVIETAISWLKIVSELALSDTLGTLDFVSAVGMHRRKKIYIKSWNNFTIFVKFSFSGRAKIMILTGPGDCLNLGHDRNNDMYEYIIVLVIAFLSCRGSVFWRAPLGIEG